MLETVFTDGGRAEEEAVRGGRRRRKEKEGDSCEIWRCVCYLMRVVGGVRSKSEEEGEVIAYALHELLRLRLCDDIKTKFT